MRDVQDAALPPSIALAVLVRPSRYLRGLLLLAALVHAGAALLVLTGAQHVALPWLLAGACSVAAALCAVSACQPLNLRWIDISKAGALSLTVQLKQPENGRAVRLLPGSLLWEQLLVLRLGSIGDGAAQVHTVLVFRDATDRASYRALTVALRAIAARNSAADGQK